MTKITNNSNNNAKKPKHVSFAMQNNEIHEVVKVPAESKLDLWYDPAELESLIAAEMEALQDCNRQCIHKPHRTNKCESHTSRGLEKRYNHTSFSSSSSSNSSNNKHTSHKHVHRVLTIYKAQLQQHKGGWEPQSLRRVSKFMSKEDTKFAIKKAKKDYSEIYGAAKTKSSSGFDARRLLGLLNRAA